MERTKGLQEYVRSSRYRQGLGLPEEAQEEYELLAQGEYNRNYLFTHPVTGKKLALRINFGSQMHLERQIEYEYKALRLLGGSGRTPQPLYVDGSRELIPYGVMVMEYLPGHALDYRTELPFAAECLADIHSVRIPEGCGLLSPKEPIRAILEECEEMVKVYMESSAGDKKKKKKIRSLLDKGWERADELRPARYKCCINTELNSTNFLINGEGMGNYLIDWEKPLYGEPAQDLGHFLAPTTTFWKTDVILDHKEAQHFIDLYIEKVGGRYDTSDIKARTNVYIPITCLRGITWCAMAWVEYEKPGKEIFNMSTYRKLEAYLSEAFLENIERNYYARQGDPLVY